MSPQERYELGKVHAPGLLSKGHGHFSVLRNSHRDSERPKPIGDGRVYFKQGEYDLARVAYEDFSRLHPRHSDLDYAVYRLGLAHYRKASRIAARDQTWTQQAVHAWANFSRRFPDSEYAQEVEAAVRASRDRLARKELGIAQFYAKRSAWPAVIARIQPMLRKYPMEDRAKHGFGRGLGQMASLAGVDQPTSLSSPEETFSEDSQKGARSLRLNADSAVYINAASGEIAAFDDELHSQKDFVLRRNASQGHGLEHALEHFRAHALKNRGVHKAWCDCTGSDAVAGEFLCPQLGVCNKSGFCCGVVGLSHVASDTGDGA